MGLAGTKVKQRFGLDPRNTAWSNDTTRFGHKHLEKFGWEPGMGLGMQPWDSHKTHIKVSVKDDTVGLGARIARKKGERADEFDNGECAGLDVFQRILGKLNGKESEVVKELEIQRKDRILNGRWGVHFVKGDVLSSTWDPETKQLKRYSNDRAEAEERDRKRARKKEKKDRKEKKEKKEKKVKQKHKVHKKKGEKSSKDKKKIDQDASMISVASPEAVSTRLSVRSKWIRQKRAAVMDPKALNEIFMVTS